MRRRLLFLAGYYTTLLLIFLIEKPLFMLYAGGLENSYPLREWLAVPGHGLPIDLSSAGYILLFPFLLALISVWWRKLPFEKLVKWYNAVIALLLSLCFVADCAIYPFWGFKLDGSVFFYLDTPKEAFASVPLLFTIIGFATVAVWSFLIYKVQTIHLRYWHAGKSAKVGSTIFLLLSGGLLGITIRGGVSQSTMNIGRAYFSTDQFLNHSAVNPLFSLLSSLGKTSDYASMYDFFSEDERSGLFDGLYTKPQARTRSLLKTERPDILLIILEGFGGDMVHSINGPGGVSVRMDSLAKEGIYFSNCYASSFRTDRGVVSLLNGHPGLPSASLMKMPVKSKTLPSLTRELVDAGYSADFLYGGDINFTNMQSYLWSMGYEEILSQSDYPLPERKTGAWGIADHIMFNHLLEKLKEKKDSLWHTAFLTLSSHEPFEVPYSAFEDKVYNSFAYTDSCLGAFVDSLKESPLWDNLLLILVPDHGYSYPPALPKNYPHHFHIPMLWLGGAVRGPLTINRIMSQSDMAATLLGQLGMNHTNFKFSRDVLSEDYTYPFAFYTFSEGLAFLDSTGTTVFQYEGERELLQEGDDCGLRLKRGKSILQTLYDDLGSR